MVRIVIASRTHTSEPAGPAREDDSQTRAAVRELAPGTAGHVRECH
jgi:hypothetical protein